MKITLEEIKQEVADALKTYNDNPTIENRKILSIRRNVELNYNKLK